MRSRAQTSLAHSLSGPISCTLIPPHQSLPTYPIVLCYVSVLSHQSLAPSLSFLPVVRCPSPSPCPSPQFPSPDPQFPIFNSPVSIHSTRGRSGWAFPAVSVTVTFRLALIFTFTHFHSHSLLIVPLFCMPCSSVSVPVSVPVPVLAPVSVCTCIDPISSLQFFSVQIMHLSRHSTRIPDNVHFSPPAPLALPVSSFLLSAASLCVCFYDLSVLCIAR